MKILHRLHLWLSVPFGIIIALVCFSGAMLVFEPEVTRAAQGRIYHVAEVKDKPLPMGELMATVRAALPDSVDITGVTVYADPGRTYQVNLSKPRRASLFIDQYSGHITGRYERIGFFATMFRLHRWLLDSSNPHGDGFKTGKLLVGVSTLMFVVALITGVAIWWPRARRGLVHSLSIPLSKGWRGLCHGLHVAGGMYALLVTLAMALTGLTWSFEWYRSAFYAVCGVESAPRGDRRGERGGRQRADYGSWQRAYDAVRAQNPDAPQITIGQATASVSLGGAGNSRAADRYDFDSLTGEIAPAEMYADSSDADKLRGWIYSIHTGSFGGMITRILWLFGALLGATLPLTGYYIWLKRLFS